MSAPVVHRKFHLPRPYLSLFVPGTPWGVSPQLSHLLSLPCHCEISHMSICRQIIPNIVTGLIFLFFSGKRNRIFGGWWLWKVLLRYRNWITFIRCGRLSLFRSLIGLLLLTLSLKYKVKILWQLFLSKHFSDSFDFTIHTYKIAIKL